jgi:hypothetical protein
VVRHSSIHPQFTPNFEAFPEKILSLADRSKKNRGYSPSQAQHRIGIKKSLPKIGPAGSINHAIVLCVFF